MGYWTTEPQEVKAWEASVTTDVNHPRTSSYNWEAYIVFSIGRREDKSVVIRAELWAKKSLGTGNVNWLFGARLSGSGEYETQYKESSATSSYSLRSTYYYIDQQRGSASYDLEFWVQSGSSGQYRQYELSVSSSGLVRVKVNGEWQDTMADVKIGDALVEAIPNVKVNGAWEEAT